ncbi:class F sortase [Microbacterium sp. bgisy207]|uniref:class F sortase n=1 Tax=Microbacterium sp. bgisy207 TaxID=3413800 RepID=UPI003EBDA46B
MLTSARVRTAAASTAAVVALSLLSGCALIPSGVGAQPPAPPSPSATAPAPPRPAVDVPVVSAAPQAVALTPQPQSLTVPDVSVSVPVVPVGVLADGFMEIPEDPAVAGWYRFGPAPASEEGNTVIAAHVDSATYGIGPFSRLRDLGVGAAVTVADESGREWAYRVESVTEYVKSELPDHLFARDGERTLVLITCGGPFDSTLGHYRDNIVVVARPADAAAR